MFDKFKQFIKDYLPNSFYKLYFKYVRKASNEPIKKLKITDNFFSKKKIINILNDLEITIIKEGTIFGSIKESAKPYIVNETNRIDQLYGTFKGYPLVVIDENNNVFKLTKDSLIKYRSNKEFKNTGISAIDRVNAHITNDRTDVYFFIRTDNYNGINRDKTLGSVSTKDLIKSGFNIIYEKESCKETS